MNSSHKSDTSVRTAQLLVALRPSIIRRLGYATAPLDLLDDDGLMGWGVGVRRLLKDSSGAGPDQDMSQAVREWLTGDLAFERLRWRSPSLVLWQLELFGRAWPDASTEADFLAVWAANVRAACTRAVSSGVAMSAGDRARTERLLRRYDGLGTSVRLADSLEELLSRVPAVDCGLGVQELLSRRLVAQRFREPLERFIARAIPLNEVYGST